MISKLILIVTLVLATSCGQKDPEGLDQNPPQNPQRELSQPMPNPPTQWQQQGYATLTNLPTLVNSINGLKNLHAANFRGQGITIAVLDNGFDGLEKARGKTLPQGIKVEEAPGNPQAKSDHGTRMAEIAYGMATGESRADGLGPNVLLYNTNGFTNLKHAVSEIIKKNVDIVLYAQIWQFGGNFDGRGIINQEVSRATDAGILWVNASGNFGDATYNGTVQPHERTKEWAELPGSQNSLKFTVTQDRIPASIVLNWNDYGDTESHVPSTDLDLFLYDQTRHEIAKSERVQVRTRAVGEKELSTLAREIIKLTLPKGDYFLKIKVNRARFGRELPYRVSIDGAFVKMENADQENSIMIPADNPSVLTVGAVDFRQTSLDFDLGAGGKPEIWTSSMVGYSDGMGIASTSTASAIVAGAIASYFSKHGGMNKIDFLRHLGEEKEMNFSPPPQPVQEKMAKRFPQIIETPRGPGGNQQGYRQNQNGDYSPNQQQGQYNGGYNPQPEYGNPGNNGNQNQSRYPTNQNPGFGYDNRDGQPGYDQGWPQDPRNAPSRERGGYPEYQQPPTRFPGNGNGQGRAYIPQQPHPTREFDRYPTREELERRS